MTSWWASPLYRASRQAGRNALGINRLAPLLFGATGIVPIGYAAFAFALGVLCRRACPQDTARHGHHAGHLRRDPDPLAWLRQAAPD